MSHNFALLFGVFQAVRSHHFAHLFGAYINVLYVITAISSGPPPTIAYRCARFGGGQLAVDGELISLPFKPLCFLYLFSKFLGNDGLEEFEIIGRVQN